MNKKTVIKYAGAILSILGVVCSWVGESLSEKSDMDEMKEEMRDEVRKEVTRQLGSGK